MSRSRARRRASAECRVIRRLAHPLGEREWERFCRDVIGRPELAHDPRFASNTDRVRHRDELEAIVNDALSKHSSAATIDRLERVGIACARLNSIEQFLEHPQLHARARWTQIGSPAGALDVLLPPVTIDDVEPRMGPVPALGEHTTHVLGELGISADTVAAWRARGIV